MNLILIRHGETDWNRLLKIQGITDNPLNSEGIHQAEETAARMRWLLFDGVFSSPLQRALQTAEIFCRGKHPDIRVDNRLCEISYGIMEGEDLRLVHKDPDHILHPYFYSPEKYIPPEEGESIAHLKQRCGLFLKDMMAEYRKYGNVLAFSHGAVIRGLVSVSAGLSDEKFWNRREPGNCSVSVIQIRENDVRVLCESENDPSKVKKCLQS